MKDSNNVTGRGRTTCPFYESLDAILGTRASSSPISVIDSGGHSAIDSAMVNGETTAEGDISGRLLKCMYYTLEIVYHNVIRYDRATEFTGYRCRGGNFYRRCG